MAQYNKIYRIIALTILLLVPLTMQANNSKEILLLIEQSYELYDQGMLDSALVLSNSALDIANDTDSTLLKAKTLINRAIIQRKMGKLQASKSDYQKAYLISTQEGSQSYISIIENNLGNLYCDMHLIDSALIFFYKRINYLEKQKNHYALIKTYCNISNTLRLNYQGDRALQYAQIALEIVESKRDIPVYGKTLTYFQLGNAYYHLDSLSLADVNYNKSLQLANEINNDNITSTCLLNLGNIAYSNNQFTKAIKLYNQCLPTIQRIGKSEQTVRVYNNLGNAWFELEHWDKARTNYQNAKNIAQKYNSYKQLGPILEGLSLTFLKTGMTDSAVIYMNERVYVAKKFYVEKTAMAIAELETHFETEKKEKEIVIQRANLQQATIHKKNLIISLVIAVFIAVSGILLFVVRSRTLKLINIKNIEEHNKEVNRLLQEQELKSLDAMIEGQDIERKRIAEDLHDRLGATLSAAKMHLEAANATINPDKYLYIDKLLNTAIDDTRQISHNMLSGTLTKFGLVAALHDMKETIEMAGKVKVSLKTIQFDERLSTEKELNLYRIVQELVSNALKHANATIIHINVEKKQEALRLSVTDNGIGFNQLKTSNEGIGLKNIQSRTSKIGGIFTMNSSTDTGTSGEINVLIN